MPLCKLTVKNFRIVREINMYFCGGPTFWLTIYCMFGWLVCSYCGCPAAHFYNITSYFDIHCPTIIVTMYALCTLRAKALFVRALLKTPLNSRFSRSRSVVPEYSGFYAPSRLHTSSLTFRSEECYDTKHKFSA